MASPRSLRIVFLGTPGFAAAFAENETMYRENPNYVLSWLTHGLLEADIAQADGSGRAIQVYRLFSIYCWVSVQR